MTLSDVVGHEFSMQHDSKPTQQKNQEPLKQKSLSYKVKGFVDDGLYVESVLVDGKPKFLSCRLENNDIVIKDLVKSNNQNYRPLESYECGYLPYSFTSEEFIELTSKPISKDEVLIEIKNQIDRFIVLKELDKHLILGDVLETFCLEWIDTVHFPFFVGETESGKSSVLHLAKWLCYRCLYAENIPYADVYNFLGFDEEGVGTIAEDEAQELWRDKEKIRMYKNSYSKGSLKPIVVISDKKKGQQFYKTFGPKWFAGEKLPQDKGFMERTPVIYMMEGEPKSNIKRLTEKEKQEFTHLRNKLLVWKLQNVGKKLERIDSGLKGRDQELWEDFLSTVAGTIYYEKCKNVVKYYTEQRKRVIRNSIEAKLFNAVIKNIDARLEINFLKYWNYIITDYDDLPGSLDAKSSRTFYPDDYSSKLTHHFVSKIFENKFLAEKRSRWIRDEKGEQHKTTNYFFKMEVLEKLASKYGVEISIDHPIHRGKIG